MLRGDLSSLSSQNEKHNDMKLLHYKFLVTLIPPVMEPDGTE